MSGMHWEKRNREHKQWHLKQDGQRRLPGWRDKSGPIIFKKWPEHAATHDNAGRLENAKRKARITLPEISILKSDD